MDAAYDPAAWHDFTVGLVGATAALLGLVFVVVSLHLKAVVSDSVLRRRSEITLGLFATTKGAGAPLASIARPIAARALRNRTNDHSFDKWDSLVRADSQR